MLQARKILRATLESESSVERWAAAQCLAHFGVCDSQVVDEIMKQLLASEEPIKHEQGIALLAKISNSTVSMPAVNHQNPCSYNPIHSPTLDYSHFVSVLDFSFYLIIVETKMPIWTFISQLFQLVCAHFPVPNCLYNCQP